ncbi:MAG: cytochrome P450 [Candidatus Promineifilaceae bacterium]|nr:cytochrome P450 [Candidatus Promineifilaceae bacterium]
MSTSSPRKYEIYGQSFKQRAYEVYASMRSNDPVFCQPGLDGETLIWFVSRYDEVVAALKDDHRFARDPRLALPSGQVNNPLGSLADLINNHMLNRDGEEHRRLRNLVSQAFTPRQVAELRPRIQTIADDLLDRVADRGQMDLIDDYAFPLPITVIAELLGIPVADRNKFRIWSDAFVTPDLSPGATERFGALALEFVGYLRELFEARRVAPQDDLISGLLQAEEAGDQLSEGELFSTVVLLIIAGHETTVGLIGNSSLALLQHPDELARLKAEPELMATAVEELLRYDPPVERALNRWTTEEVELGGRRIPAGQPVILILGAANRDEQQFDDPDDLDIERRPNPHVAFGRGAHYCLGAPLARLEGEIALNTLWRRLPNLRLAIDPGELQWRSSPTMRGVTALPVVWDVP